MKKIFATTLLTMMAAGAVSAQDASVGFGTHVWFSEYKGVDAAVYPLPLVHFENNSFYVKNLGAGAYLFKNDRHEVTLGVGFMPLYFKADDSDDRRMKRLDDRKLSMSGRVGYVFKSEFGRFSADVEVDALGRSDGVLATVAYAYPHQAGSLSIVPVVALTWASANFNDYYYGVSAKESRRSGLAAYDADSGVTPMAGLLVDYRFDPHWSVYGTTSATFLSNEAKDSPMTDGESVRWGVGAGIKYHF